MNNSVMGVSIDRVDGEARLTYGNIVAPATGPLDLLIRPTFVGLCGSDLELYRGHFEHSLDIGYPHVVGHEWAGRIVEIGPRVAGEFQVGDLVVGHGDLGDNRWFGVTDDGAMSDLFAVPATMCFGVPEGVSEMQAALIEPLACVLQGLTKVGGANGSDTVVVLGCGSLGLAMVALAASTGAFTVAVDPSDLRLDVARNLGASLATTPGGHVADTLRRETGGLATLVVEASGASPAQADALTLAAPRGRVLYMGIGDGSTREVSLQQIQEKDLTISASTGAPVTIWPSALRLLQRTGLDLAPMVSDTFKFADAQSAFEAAARPTSSAKVLLTP